MQRIAVPSRGMRITLVRMRIRITAGEDGYVEPTPRLNATPCRKAKYEKECRHC